VGNGGVILDYPVDPFVCVGELVDAERREVHVSIVVIVYVFESWLVPVDIKGVAAFMLVMFS
jgi:hypothetical protein